MSDHIDLPNDEIRILGIYKLVKEGKPVAMTLEDIQALPKYIKEIKKAEDSNKEIFEQIDILNNEIKERLDKIHELENTIDPRIKYLKMSPVIQSKQVNHVVKEEYSTITPEAILEVLKANPKAGNSLIAEKLNLDNSKGIQNKIYSVVKKLISDGKVSEDRTVL